MNLFRIASILSFERNILSFIIIAGRYEDAIRKYGEENKDVIDKLKKLDKSGSLKFLDWQMKQYKNNKNIDIEDLAELSNMFERYKSSFKKKDINQYTFDELYNEADSYINESRNKAIETADFSDIEKYSEALTKFSIPRGSVKFDGDYGPGWEVWAIRSKAGSVEAGKNTAWCISMPNSSYYETYEDDGAVNFFCINKNEKPVVYPAKAIKYEKLDLSRICLSLYVSDNQGDRKIDKVIITTGNNQEVEKSFISEKSTLDVDKAISDATQFIKTAKLIKSKDASSSNIKDMIAAGRNSEALAKYIAKYYDEFNENDKLFAAMMNFDVFFEYIRRIKHKPSIKILEKAAKSKNNVNSKYINMFAKHNQADWYNNEHNLPDGSYLDSTFNICYIKNHKKHREDGPALEYASGDKAWYLNNRPHRIGGPAIEYVDGDKEWWVNGERHREDGPAVENADGTKEWYLNGKKYSEEEYNEKMKSVESAGSTKELDLNDKKYPKEEYTGRRKMSI